MKISNSGAISNQEVFFKINNGDIIKSNDIREIVDNKTEISPLISQIFDVYGSRVPYPFTVFKGIYRLDDRNPFEIHFENGQIKLKDPNPLRSIDQDWNLNNYFEALENAFECKTKYAAVFLSSGWDSSTILGALVKKMPAKNIKTFTLSLEVGLNEPLNKFELKKAKAICAHYGIENIVVPCSYYERFDEALNKSSIRMLFSGAALSHKCLWESVIEYGLSKEETTIYAGEFSDGAHNFGFAQHFGAVYPEKGFRQYGDKIRSYFLSPSFLKRTLQEEDIKEDFLVKNFAPSELVNYKDWNEIDLMLDLAKNTFINDSRGPFKMQSIMKEKYKTTADQLISDVIFQEISPTDLSQWYSLILRLYNNFHWSGSTVRGIELHNPGGYKVNMPYGNKELLSLLEEMPTRFGRGLEPLPTKFPLKKYCELRLKDYPFEIQEGHHAYVYDVDQSISLVNLVYENTSLKKLLNKSWIEDKFGIRKEFLNENIFFKINKQIISADKVDASSIFHAKSFHMLDQFLDYAGYVNKSFN